MCQKAFGGFFGPLVSAEGFEWTRGTPGRFDSSNRNWRRFCGDCGTPLTYEFEGGVEIAIGSLDNPEMAPPVVQVNSLEKLAFFDGLCRLPGETADERKANAAWNAGVVSNQQPDHDT